MQSFPQFPRYKSRKDKSSNLLPALLSSVSPSVARSYTTSSSSSSLFHRDKPVLIDDRIFHWYRDQQTHTLINKLELRKQRDRARHEFVVIHIDGNLVYRVDRRPVGGPSLEVIFDQGCEAEDSITLLSKEKLSDIQLNTDCKITVHFDSEQKPDLYAVLAICDTIRKDPDTKKYTLQQFNCYFVARTIVTLVMRHYLLQYSTSFPDPGWYALTESAISRCLSSDHWKALDKAMKAALITVLEKALWPIVTPDAELLLSHKRERRKLESDTRDIIRKAVEESDVELIDESLKEIVYRWVLEAAEATLWYDNLERNLLDQEYRTGYEQCAGSVLSGTMKPGLEQQLPEGIGARLPKRLLNRFPPSLLATLPSDVIARFPRSYLGKLPDEMVQNVPDTFVETAPDEYLQALPASTFKRAPTRVVLRLPEDLRRVPQELLDVSIRRIQTVLEEAVPSEQVYRPLALNLLKRLPEDLLQQLPPDIRSHAINDNKSISTHQLPEEVRSMRSHVTNDDDSKPLAGTASANKTTRHAKVSPLDYILRATPRQILVWMPPIMSEIYPISWYKNLSAEGVALFPIEAMAKLRPRFLAKLPIELLEKIPENTLGSLPREMLERLPDELLHRLPVQLLRNIPKEFYHKLPENVTDLIHDALASEIFGGDDLKMELSKHAGNVVNGALRDSLQSVLPKSIVRISFYSRSNRKVRHAQTYEDLQGYILNMNRDHSRIVARAAHLGVGEEDVYKNLRQKKEDIWRGVYHLAIPSQNN